MFSAQHLPHSGHAAPGAALAGAGQLFKEFFVGQPNWRIVAPVRLPNQSVDDRA